MLMIKIILPVPNTVARFHLHREARDTLTWSKQFPATGVTV